MKLLVVCSCVPCLFLSDAAVVMLSGQVADGLTTVFAGELVSLNNITTTLT